MKIEEGTPLHDSTNAGQWAEEFILKLDKMEHGMDEHTVLSWFASAIEAGKKAGYAQAKKEENPDWPVKPELAEEGPFFGPCSATITDEQMESIIFQAIGAASMCWMPRPYTQTFDSTKARAVGDEVVSLLHRYVHDKIIGLEDKVAADLKAEKGN